jgi:hypothetical protein
MATELIASSLNNLTVIVFLTDDGNKWFYSNFNPLNQAILSNLIGGTWESAPEMGGATVRFQCFGRYLILKIMKKRV